MKWGLDLRGGVRFLMEVDMNSALAKRQEQLQDTLRNELRKEKIQFTAIKNSDKFGTTVTLTCGVLVCWSKPELELIMCSQPKTARL